LRKNLAVRFAPYALLTVESREFSEDDMALLRDLARMAEQELAALQLVTMDALTLLSNRRGYEVLSRHALGLCRRLDKPASLLFFDLDLFKQINDRFGHAEGDRALTTFAQLLKQTFRESDVLGRLGGDEFAVCWPLCPQLCRRELKGTSWFSSIALHPEHRTRHRLPWSSWTV
jgi:GGDEF domain-containing protein